MKMICAVMVAVTLVLMLLILRAMVVPGFLITVGCWENLMRRIESGFAMVAPLSKKEVLKYDVKVDMVEIGNHACLL